MNIEELKRKTQESYLDIMRAPNVLDTSANELSTGLYQNDTQDAIADRVESGISNTQTQ